MEEVEKLEDQQREAFRSEIRKLREIDWSDPLITNTALHVLQTAIALSEAEMGVIAAPNLQEEPPQMEVTFGIRTRGEMDKKADLQDRHKVTVISAQLGQGLAEMKLQVSVGRSFQPEHPKIIQVYAHSAADVLRGAIAHSQERRERTTQTFMAMAAMAETLDGASQWTAGHSARVAQISGEIAREIIDNDFSLPSQYRAKLEALIMIRAFAMHDLGKVGVPHSILESSDHLSNEEREEMSRHCDYAKSILGWLEGFGESADISDIALYHHERWDGKDKGYFGLAGDEIPLAARIAAVADAYDAMINERPYRSTVKTPMEAAQEIWNERGKQFDPRVVEIGFVPWWTRQYPNRESHMFVSSVFV